MPRKSSSGVFRGIPSEPFRVRVDFVPEIAGFRSCGKNVFPVHALARFVLIAFVTPLREAFYGQVSDIVTQCRPFFVERSEPGADVFRADAVISRPLDTVSESRPVPGDPSADRFHRFFRHSARVFEEFDPETPLVEKTGEQDVLSIDALSGIRIDVSVYAPFFQSGLVERWEFLSFFVRVAARRNGRSFRPVSDFCVGLEISVVEHSAVVTKCFYP